MARISLAVEVPSMEPALAGGKGRPWSAVEVQLELVRRWAQAHRVEFLRPLVVDPDRNLDRLQADEGTRRGAPAPNAARVRAVLRLLTTVDPSRLRGRAPLKVLRLLVKSWPCVRWYPPAPENPAASRLPTLTTGG